MGVLLLLPLLLPAMLRNPVEFATRTHIDICAGNVRVLQLQPSELSAPLPAQAQRLPLGYASSWPIWVVRQSGEAGTLPVTRVPGPATGADSLDTWVAPSAFEQLWLPADLPTPSARPALVLVLRNGEPRYLAPTIDTYVAVGDVLWRNRGLHSVPLPSTWLHFGEIPADDLRLSAYLLPAEDTGGSVGAEAGGSAATVPRYERCLDPARVGKALRW